MRNQASTAAAANTATTPSVIPTAAPAERLEEPEELEADEVALDEFEPPSGLGEGEPADPFVLEVVVVDGDEVVDCVDDVAEVADSVDDVLVAAAVVVVVVLLVTTDEVPSCCQTTLPREGVLRYWNVTVLLALPWRLKKWQMCVSSASLPLSVVSLKTYVNGEPLL